MSKPQRIQRKRTKGWRMPENSIYVGRPTIYGNPTKHELVGHEKAVHSFTLVIAAHIKAETSFIKRIKKELRGKHLVCWCPMDKPCHADVLLELANEVQP